ncbi:MAG: helix-turn-helix transcriptional regulator [Clostridia bacterium]|nr:helix-turn-helix transcriptional regulator [Clostridia bacterium]
MKITRIKSIWPEKKGFDVLRKNTGDMYIFVHFLSPVTIDYGLNAERVKQGGCIIFDKFSYQHFSSPDCTLTHNWFHMKGDMEPLLKKYSIETNKIYYPENDEHITVIIQNMEIEFMIQKPHWESICDLGIEEILARMSREIDFSAASPNPQKKEALIRLRTKVHLEYNQNWTVSRMAKEAGMSESRFYADYSKIFGIAPARDLQNTRIDHAKRMLLSGMSVAAVAEQTGFGSTYHFIRQFKKQCGITPGKYVSTKA